MKDLFVKLMFLRKRLTQRGYSGRCAEKYEASRSKSDRWRFEEESFQEIFSNICSNRGGLVVIDIPVGTNRFHEYIERCGAVSMAYGIDSSDDMLSQAQKKNTKKYIYLKRDIFKGDISVLGDIVVCFRFLNLFSYEEIEIIIRRLSAFCCGHLIISVRLVEDGYTSRILEGGKVYLHIQHTFMLALECAGFKLLKINEFRDHKPGIYFVIWARKISSNSSDSSGGR